MRSFRRFREWLIETNGLAHDDDQYEMLIADTVYRLVSKAVTEFFQNRKQKRLSELLVTASGGHAVVRNLGSQQSPKYAVSISIPPKIKGVQLPQHFLDLNLQVRIIPISGESRATYGHGLIEIGIDTNVLSSAQSINDPSIAKMLMKIQYQLHHEATHISSGQVGSQNKVDRNPYLSGSAQQGTPDYNQGKINYYTDSGEMRAHARQYAVMYSRFYPGQPFDPQKLMALAGHDPKIARYMQGLGEQPGMSKTWGMDISPYHQQMQAAHQQFLPLIKHFVNQRSGV